MLDKDVCKACFKEESQPMFPQEEWFAGLFSCPPGIRIGMAIVEKEPPENCPRKNQHRLEGADDSHKS